MSAGTSVLRRYARPSSLFPFAPLTDEAADREREMSVRELTLWVLFSDADAGLQRRCLARARQRAADLMRSTDLRCGYVREVWASLDGNDPVTGYQAFR